MDSIVQSAPRSILQRIGFGSLLSGENMFLSGFQVIEEIREFARLDTFETRKNSVGKLPNTSSLFRKVSCGILCSKPSRDSLIWPPKSIRIRSVTGEIWIYLSRCSVPCCYTVYYRFQKVHRRSRFLCLWTYLLFRNLACLPVSFYFPVR